MDSINRRTWKAKSSLRLYRRLSGYFDEGERVAMAALAPFFHDRRVLDIGVGSGRTTPMLEPFASSYVGVDYTPEMVTLCRDLFPGVSFAEADARDLSQFADATFDCAVFSCNAIDSVDEDGRARVMAECARVLTPGGAFLFSTFNLDGPGFRDRHNNRTIELSPNPVRSGYSLAKYLVGGGVGYWRILRHSHKERRADDHAILLHKAHDFGILVYATRLSAIGPQLEVAGFDPQPRIFGVSGAEITTLRADDEEYVHVLARKRY